VTALTRVAWVESPLQAINAVEFAGRSGESVVVVPRNGVAQLPDTIAALAARAPSQVVVETAAAAPWSSPFGRANRRLVGDVFSGHVRAAIARGAGDLVVVDDGSSMLHAAAVLVGDATLRRAGGKESTRNRLIAPLATRRLLAAARGGAVSLFTVYDDSAPVRKAAASGIHVEANDYGWLRSVGARPDAGKARAVVLGSALAYDGLIREDAYRAWVADLTAAGPVSYLPHRRERGPLLDAVAATPGVTVEHSGLPVELAIGMGAPVASVRSLPTSAAMTLRRLVPEGTPLDVTRVPDDWWTARADADFRRTVDTLMELT
jgi:hypothetical protein